MSEHDDKIRALEEKRAARKAAAEDAEKAQLAIDLEAVDALEEEFGYNEIVAMRVPHVPGLPVMVAARCPTEPEMKRYKHRLKLKKIDGDMPDYNFAQAELAESTLKYPDKDTFAKLCAVRPAIKEQLGSAAAKLAQAHSEAEGKG